MGILKKKKRKITIEATGRKVGMIQTNDVMKGSEVCDLLLSALCTAIKACAEGNDEYLELFKTAAIREIQKLK